MGPSLSFALLTLSSSAHLPNLSSLSRSDFPNSLYLFEFPHFTRIPVTKLILLTLSGKNSFKRCHQLDKALATPFAWTRLVAFPFQQFRSPRELHIYFFSNSTSSTAPRLFIKTECPPVVGTAEPCLWTTDYLLRTTDSWPWRRDQ